MITCDLLMIKFVNEFWSIEGGTVEFAPGIETYDDDCVY